jgi:hypothetical protein
MMSKRFDPMIVKEYWVNDLLECLLILLARGKAFSHGENIARQSFTTDYLVAIYFLDQEDMRLLMPEPRGLHDFCSMPCVAMEIYDNTHMKREVSDNIFIVSDKESRMAAIEDERGLIFSPSKSDRDILQ